MSAATTAVEGYIPFRDWKTWYRVVGEGDEPGKLPLLHCTVDRVPRTITSSHLKPWPQENGG